MGKVGAPVGNNNALKHGFYSKHFRESESVELEAMLVDNLQDEINMMRVAQRRIFAQGNLIKDPQCLMNWLGILGISATRLAGLLKTQLILHGQADETADVINQAMEQIMKEYSIK